MLVYIRILLYVIMVQFLEYMVICRYARYLDNFKFV
jgi:hypothetical protein